MSSHLLLRLLSKQKFALGLKNRLTSSEMVNPFTVVRSQAMEMSRGMSANVSHIKLY